MRLVQQLIPQKRLCSLNQPVISIKKSRNTGRGHTPILHVGIITPLPERQARRHVQSAACDSFLKNHTIFMRLHETIGINVDLHIDLTRDSHLI